MYIYICSSVEHFTKWYPYGSLRMVTYNDELEV